VPEANARTPSEQASRDLVDDRVFAYLPEKPYRSNILSRPRLLSLPVKIVALGDSSFGCEPSVFVPVVGLCLDTSLHLLMAIGVVKMVAQLWRNPPIRESVCPFSTTGLLKGTTSPYIY
jgi:hypothetical protein